MLGVHTFCSSFSTLSVRMKYQIMAHWNGHDVPEKIKLWQAILSGANKIHIPLGDSSATNPVL